jgi:hypothetical protein
MAYYPDLSRYQYFSRAINPPSLTIGWLDVTHGFPVGSTDSLFTERLWLYCRNRVWATRGYHQCEICSEPQWPYIATRGDQELKLGSAEIRVLGTDNIIYAAPDLIYHYVVDHQYLPPQEFIDAVVHGLSPDSDAYQALKQKYWTPPSPF